MVLRHIHFLHQNFQIFQYTQNMINGYILRNSRIINLVFTHITARDSDNRMHLLNQTSLGETWMQIRLWDRTSVHGKNMCFCLLCFSWRHFLYLYPGIFTDQFIFWNYFYENHKIYYIPKGFFLVVDKIHVSFFLNRSFLVLEQRYLAGFFLPRSRTKIFSWIVPFSL